MKFLCVKLKKYEIKKFLIKLDLIVGFNFLSAKFVWEILSESSIQVGNKIDFHHSQTKDEIVLLVCTS